MLKTLNSRYSDFVYSSIVKSINKYSPALDFHHGHCHSVRSVHRILWWDHSLLQDNSCHILDVSRSD